VGLARLARLRRHVAAKASARSWAAGAALLAFACSVYETPGSTGEAIDGSAGTAGDDGSTDGAAAGTTPSSSGTSAMSGAGAGAGTMNGAGSASAGSRAGSPNDNGGSAGEPAVEPTTGGEGGAPAVDDACPADPNKLVAGQCGCGVPEPPSATHSDCQTLKALLVHRYDFEGGGTAVKDRVGTAHGTVARGATLSKLDGKGVVLLGGGDVGAYVDLPNGILSSLSNATIEAWVTWGGGNSWQRLFDFGDSTATPPENNQASGKTYLFVTPKGGTGTAQIAFSLGGVTQELDVRGPLPLPQTMKQVVAVVDDSANWLTLYIDGVKSAEQAWTGALSQINDVNVWLGRSQYANDDELNAVYHEFRMYNAALTAAQVAAMFNAGTDPQFLAY
jgi:hypothetical protein